MGSPTPRFVVRADEAPTYAPANHHGTLNRRLIGPDTVGATSLEVVLGTLAPGGAALCHAHPGIDQACVLLEGRARVELDGEVAEIGPGDACFFPADRPHRFTVLGDRPVRVLVIYTPPYGEDPRKVRLLEERPMPGEATGAPPAGGRARE